MDKNYIKNFISIAFSFLFKNIRLSHLIGSKLGFISLGNAFVPLLGIYNNISTVSILFILQIIISILYNPILGITSLLLHKLPSFVGILFLKTENKLLKILLPLIYIVLFISHPTGSNAMLYSTYWIIPIFLSIKTFDNKFINIFFRFLSANFIIHATGTIIYLYTKQLNSEVYNSLIPLVLIERLLLTTISVCAYYSIDYILNHVTNYNYPKLGSNEIAN